MLEFPVDFFEGEEREGFFVDATMKTIWAAELEVLQEIAIICNRHGLKWFAAYGTLLGAVRHRGFIPWDDDLDIMMVREDYMKLLEYLPEELPAGFQILCPMIEKDFQEYQCSIMNASTISISPGRLEKFHGCPFIVGVDIFPLDYVPRDIKKRTYQKTMFTLIRQAIWNIKYEEHNEENCRDVEDALQTLEMHLHVHLGRWLEGEKNKELVNQLWGLANEVARMYSRRDGEFLTPFLNYIKAQNEETFFFDKRWFDEVDYLEFEHLMMPVPKQYHEILTRIYGDYNVRVQMTQTHDYPMYKKQLEAVREKMREMESLNEKEKVEIDFEGGFCENRKRRG